MRSRLAALTLGVFLTFVLLACSKKPDQTTDTSTATPAPAATAPAPAQPAPAPVQEQPRPQPIIVPSGTTVTVRLAQAVGSKLSQAGQSFSGTVASAIVIDGRTAIPAGATASGTVVDAKPLGRFAGGASLSLQLTSINLRGTDRAIQTSVVSQTAKGKGKRTAVLAGGGAAVGALIGGLAGGGKGAGIGALAGGGAGTGGAAFTGNKDIVLPAESALSFTLTQSLEVKER
jgi:hypothetical protein